MPPTVGTFVPLQQRFRHGTRPIKVSDIEPPRPNPHGGFDASGYEGYRFPNPMDEATVVESSTVSVKHPGTRSFKRVTVTSMQLVSDGVAEVDVDGGYVMLWDTARKAPYVTRTHDCPPGYRMYAGQCFRRVVVPGDAKTPPGKPCAAGTEWAWHAAWGVWYCRNVKLSSKPTPKGSGSGKVPPVCPPGYQYSIVTGQCEPGKTPPSTPPGGKAPTGLMGTPRPAPNPAHPVYLNTLSLPWAYPWSYTHNPRTLQWGCNHPRFGYQTPWSGYGGYYPMYQGRSFYDNRVVCDRVEDSQECPVGKTVQRDDNGDKLCCDEDGVNPWVAGQWPQSYWWCPQCGHYPYRHHSRHRGHRAHGGPRHTAPGGGHGPGGGPGGGGPGGGGPGGGGPGGGGPGGGGGGGGGRMNNPCNACDVQVATDPRAAQARLSGYAENPAVARVQRRVQPWNMAGAGPAAGPPTLPDPPPPPDPKPGTGTPVPPKPTWVTATPGAQGRFVHDPRAQAVMRGMVR